LGLTSPDLWDSGKQYASGPFAIPYFGKPIKSGEQVYWAVRIWDEKGRATPWSRTATWLEGIASQDWKAKWISSPGVASCPTLTFDNTFLAGTPKRAICFICGLGQYKLEINGRPVTDDWLSPSWTQYQKTCLYDTYDVTRFLHSGNNRVDVTLGNGMYDMSGDTRGSQQKTKVGDKKLLCQIQILNSSGSLQTVESDDGWKVRPGPETYSGVFGGEDWNSQVPTEWSNAAVVQPPTGTLHGITRAAPPLRSMKVQSPLDEKAISDGVRIYDLGQNAPYVPEIVVSGKAGDTLTLWPAEILKPDGDIDQSTMRAGKKCSYALSGGVEERWHPLFWYCGSRYWKIEAKDRGGNPIPVDSILKSFTGLLVHGSEAEAGDFQCSNETLNRIYSMVKWSMKSNFSHVVSDCPHREKSGWLEQLNMMGPDLMYCYDMRKMFDKAMHDMADAQHADGRVPTMAPEYFFYDDGYADSVEWGGSFILVAEMMKTWYGDDAPIREHYSAMNHYMAYLATRAKDDILDYGLGDWVGYGADPRTPAPLTGTAYYYKLATTMTGFARYLKNQKDVGQYKELADRIYRHFNEKFYDPATGKYAQGSQSSQATALDFGLVPAGQHDKVFRQLIADIQEHHYGFSLGEAGNGPMLRSLTDNGHSSDVSRLMLQRELPGYVYLLDRGFTTMPETWDGGPISHNHFMLGQAVEWFYGTLLGIQPDPAKPGFEHFMVHIHVVPQVTWAQGHYDSVRGRISVAWKIKGNKVQAIVDVPPGTTATIHFQGKQVEAGPGLNHYSERLAVIE
jgi:hypothetical protein